MIKGELISIIIVNFNGIKYLKNCLESLFKQKYKDIEIIFVDNGSHDDSVKFVKNNFPKVKIISNQKNKGFAEANNQGYKISKGDYVLFLNNDTKVTPDFIKYLLLAFNNNPKLGCIQSKLLLMDERNLLDSVGAFLTPSGFLYHYGVRKLNTEKYNKPILVHTAKGACMMVRKTVLEKVMVFNQVFDNDYFAYFEESDLCQRIWMAGYEVGFEPKSIVYHKMGATSSTLSSSFVQYHSYKNRLNSYLKNLELINLIKIGYLHLILCLGLSIYYFLSGNRRVGFSILRALWWNLVNINKTMQKRSIIQRKIRKKSDKEIFKYTLKKMGINYYRNLFSGLVSFSDIDLNQ